VGGGNDDLVVIVVVDLGHFSQRDLKVVLFHRAKRICFRPGVSSERARPSKLNCPRASSTRRRPHGRQGRVRGGPLINEVSASSSLSLEGKEAKEMAGLASERKLIGLGGFIARLSYLRGRSSPLPMLVDCGRLRRRGRPYTRTLLFPPSPSLFRRKERSFLA